jgi:hypothetical protein
MEALKFYGIVDESEAHHAEVVTEVDGLLKRLGVCAAASGFHSRYLWPLNETPVEEWVSRFRPCERLLCSAIAGSSVLAEGDAFEREVLERYRSAQDERRRRARARSE